MERQAVSSDFRPAIKLVRFDSFLDSCVRLVFGEKGDGFSKNGSGCYICGKDMFGTSAFGDRLERHIRHGVPASGYCFIIGDCDPADNILLSLDGAKPRFRRKYFLTERDIGIDLLSFNRRADSVFNRIFRKKIEMPAGVFAIKHSRLGAGTLKRILYGVFGPVNCSDGDAEALAGSGKCLVSSNDLVEADVKDKVRLNRNAEMLKIAREIRQYVSECTGTDWSA